MSNKSYHNIREQQAGNGYELAASCGVREALFLLIKTWLSVNLSEPACLLSFTTACSQVHFIRACYGCSIGKQQSGEANL